MMKNTILATVIFILTFGVCANAQIDYTEPLDIDWQTLTLWHFEEINRQSSGWIYSEPDNVNGSTRLTTREGGSGNPNAGTIVPGPTTALGNAVYFETNEWARTYSSTLWDASYNSVKVEGWVKIDGDYAGARNLIVNSHNWRVLIDGSRIRFIIYDNVSSASEINFIVDQHYDEWLHFTAIYDETGFHSFEVFNLAGTWNQYNSRQHGENLRTPSDGFINVARDGFKGSVDEIRVSVPTQPEPEFLSPYSDTPYGTVGLWHLDEIIGSITPDDDSKSINLRGYDLELADNGVVLADANSVPGGIGLGNCLWFDGMQGFARNQSIKTPSDNFRVEAWISIDPIIFTVDNATRTVVGFFDDSPFSLVVHSDNTGSFNKATARFKVTDINNNSTEIWNYISPTNVWQHIAAEFDNGQMTLYLNGRVIASGSTGAPTAGSQGDQNLYIGAKSTSRGYWRGYIDEVRITGDFELGCGDWGYLIGDINRDCYVDTDDLKLLAQDWLTSEDSGPFQIEYQYINVPFAVAAPTIDGVLTEGEWDDAKLVELVYPDLVTSPNVGTQREQEPDSPEDFSGYFHYKWDADYFYVGFEVIDDVFVAPPSTGGYPRDHVLFGFNPDAANTDPDKTLVFEMFRDNTGVARTNIYWNDGGSLTLTNAVIASSESDNNWRYEAALKWSEITGDSGFVPTNGYQFGTAILMCDMDDPDGHRETFLMSGGNGMAGFMESPEHWHTTTLTDGLVCGDNGWVNGDLSMDCLVNLDDYAVLAVNWLGCTDPDDEECTNLFED